MNVNVQSINFNVKQNLIDFIKKKTEQLPKIYDRVLGCDVYLKLDNTSEKENKIAELKILIPGGEFVVKKQCQSFEESVDLSVEVLKRQLRKKKEKERFYQN
ncbi:MAG: ribosomal subunit interface protein [Flavobacteriales bacterium]|nr:MAG: ribosomal subunit interface protein [Flavobacteriales bacterium]PIE49337.1 MAG: ribosomal subunit interface protein [Flavobacteriales bacterium]